MPSSAPPGWDGTATAGAALYLLLFAAALWGTWVVVRGGPGGLVGPGGAAGADEEDPR